MDYMTSCIILSNLVCIPAMGLLLWQMGWKNWSKWLLIIPSIALMDLDHFLLTNVPGFGAEPASGQKILHVAHTFEFLALEIVLILIYFLWVDPRQDRNIKTWFFPLSPDYSKQWKYYLAWTVRILIFGLIIHWLLDLVIYTVHHKWDYLYVSLVEYFLHPT